jgi:succinate-semialdehyde dehydrogenase/glutarate-semialdehyde dehydrogenase
VEYENEADAILYANQSPYGLGAGFFSRNIEQAKELAKKLECGMVAINTNVRSEPAVSFGGVKNSGFGRELGSAGSLEFANLKSILVS